MMPSPRYAIELVPHDPAWAAIAAREGERLRGALGDALVAVHHIGSTSIAGIRAKPIVDLMPLVTSLDALDAKRAAVEELGWSWGGEMGIAGRRYGVLVDPANGKRVAQMHAFADGWPDAPRHLAFRDYLRAHEEEAHAYEAEKLRARELHPDDVLAYNGAKSDWIKACEKRALQWAVYRHHASEYDALVSAEDCDGNLVPAIAAVARVDGAFVVDVGTGTGRVARLLLPRARRIVGVEPQEAMLAIARVRLEEAERSTGSRASFELHRGSADALPVDDGVADVAIAGWVFGHFRHWMPDGWREDVARAIAEMERVVAPGGAIVIIETLGTGRGEGPAPPNDALAEYYTWLESEHGFTRKAIRTDYAFPDVETAARICGFFFGDSMAKTIRERGSARVAEHTGIWSRVTERP